MTRYQPGIRVGAIRDADNTTVNLYGYGVYEGDLPAPGNPLGMSDAEYEESIQQLSADNDQPPEEVRAQLDKLKINPCIKLDNGHTVWGRECWWGPEDKIKAMIGDRTVVEVLPPSALQTA